MTCVGGTGIGGYVFARLLLEKGFKVSLVLVDVREEALLKGRKWIQEELRIEPETYALDARKVHTLNQEFDLAVMWGSSAPHFDPWSLNKLLSSLSSALSRDSVLVLQESDRMSSIVYRGYRHVNVVTESGRAILDVFTGYDVLKGTCRRLMLDLRNPKRTVLVDLLYWSMTALGALLWLFFEDVDVLEAGIRRMYVLTAIRPRKVITPEDLSREPLVFKRISSSEVLFSKDSS